MKTFDIKFTVEGSGPFPLDMLRYDACYPRSETDAITAQDPERGRRRVTLTSPERHRHWEPTARRWESFGWGVISWEAVL